MNLDELKQLVASGEGPTLELKRSTAESKRAFQTLCAFLNTKGGSVLLGVSDKGVLVGQQASQQTMRELSQHLKLIEPQPDVETLRVPIQGELVVIVLRVGPEQEDAPFTYDGRAYQRVQDQTQRMSTTELKKRVGALQVSLRRWELEVDDRTELADLDREEILRARSTGIEKARIGDDPLEIEGLLARLDLAVNGRLVRATRILFSRALGPADANCLLQMGRFRGSSVTALMVDNRQEHLNAFAMAREGVAFLLRHLPMAGVITSQSARRQDRLLVPEVVLRELIHNAVMHRDYSLRDSHVAILIFDDRVEIQSVGRVMPGIRFEDLAEGRASRRHRNPLIAEIFYKAGLVDRWGSGLGRVLDACRAADIPLPRFEDRDGFFVVTLDVAVVSGTPTFHLRHQVSTKSALSRHQVKVLALAGTPASNAELMAGTNLRDRTRFRQAVIRPLLDATYLVMTIPDKPRSSQQKYVTTELGKKALSKHAANGD